MHCDRLHDRGSGDRARLGRSGERLGRVRRWGLALGAWLVLGGVGCSKDPEVVAVSLSKEVDAALAAQKWELAEKKAQEIVNLAKLSDVSRDQAKLKLDQSKSEQQAKLQYQKFIGYVNSETDTAVGAYRDMPESSYYRQQAKPEYDKLRPTYIDDHLTRAQSALGGGRCDDVKAQLQLVLDVDPQNGKAIDIGKKPCPAKKP
jgi:hypothetical protein